MILITIDTLRADHLPMYGYQRNTTPFLKSLADKGILYERMYSASSHTGPCHASLFTSLYPDEHGILQNTQALTTKSPTLADIFKKQGYETAAFTSVAFLSDVMRGFDVKDLPSTHWKNPRKARATIDAALIWIDKQPADRKFFVWVHLFDAHNSMEKEKEFAPYAQQLVKADGALPDNALNDYWIKSFGLSTTTFSDFGLARRLRSYDARIRYTDEQIGRFYGELTQPDDPAALWIVTADHGEGLGSHDYLGHDGAIFEEQTHIPMIIVFPDGAHAGTRVPEMTRQVDIMPSLCKALGVVARPQWQGAPQWPFAEKAESREAFITRRPRRSNENWPSERLYAIRGERWKVLWAPHGDGKLFDLTDDPFETTDLIEKETERGQAMTAQVSAKVRSLDGKPGHSRRKDPDPEDAEDR